MTFFITERPAVDFTPRTPAQTLARIGKAFSNADGDAAVRGVLAGGLAALVGADADTAASIGAAVSGKHSPVPVSVFTPNREVIVYGSGTVPMDVLETAQAYVASTRLQETDPRGDQLVFALVRLGYSVTGRSKAATSEHWRLESAEVPS